MPNFKLIKLSILLLLLCIANTIHFPLSLWKNYHLDSPHLIFSHSQSPFTIELLDIPTSEFQAKYYYSEERILIVYQKANIKLVVLSENETIVIHGLKSNQKLTISKNMKQYNGFELATAKDFTIVPFQTTATLDDKLSIQGDYDMLIFSKPGQSFLKQWQSTLQKTRQAASDRLRSWMTKMSINASYFSFTEAMFSQTISTICKEGSHIGLCDLAHIGTKHAQHEIDIRHSLLVIDELFIQFRLTSLFLFQHMIGLLEDRLFYEEGSLPFVPIPQHLDIFKSYSQFAAKDIKRLNIFSIRAKAVLNGLMNQMLLSQVNHLQQQINYRQNKKIHPTLYKMINLKWKANSAKKAVSSVYEQSFTPDYFYNYPNQTVDTCISKLVWLGYATTHYYQLLKTVGDYDDISSLQQPTSLLKIIKYFAKGDPQSQQGKFYSINDIGGGVRVYAKHAGYQSLLPYIYQFSQIFPDVIFNNITTKYGLASLNVNHLRVSTHYEYRGNIHTYFNYKILFWAKRIITKTKHDPKNVASIDATINNIRDFLIRQWNEGKSFTMWTAEGVGLRNKKQLSILNAGFFRQK